MMPIPHIDFDVNEIAGGIGEAMGDENDFADTGGVPSRMDPTRVTLTAEQEAAIAAQEAAAGIGTDDGSGGEQQQEQQLPSTILVDGREIPLDTLRSMVQFDEFLRTNPVAAQRLRESLDPNMQLVPKASVQAPPPVVEQQPVITTPPPNLSVPEDFDTEDPTNRFFLDRFNKLSEDNTALRNIVESQLAEQQRLTAETAMSTGISRFTRQYSGETGALTDDDVAAVRIAASHVYEGFVAKHNGNVESATYDALESSMWTIPAIRSKLLAHDSDVAAATARDDTARQRRLTALGGSRGSGNAGSIPPPSTPQEGRLAMVRAIREGMATEQPA